MGMHGNFSKICMRNVIAGMKLPQEAAERANILLPPGTMRAGVLILVAAAVSAPAAAASAANATAVGGSCAAARRAATRGLQCSIAKGGGCDNGYARAYFCAAPGFGRVALGACYLAWLGLLFALLGSTADEYFSPALEQLSDDAGLPPRFAGVTLLALGNGAPDVSSTIHAVASSPTGYRLALGALTGAGMFVGTCVAGAVTLVADGARSNSLCGVSA